MQNPLEAALHARTLLPGVCERQDDGESRLYREVDGEDGGLQGGELGSGQGAEGDYAADEGLEDLGAEEGAVAVWVEC